MPVTSTLTPSGDASLNGVLSGTKWAVSNLSFSFPSNGSFYGSGYGDGESTNGFEALNAAQQAVVRTTLAAYASVANLTFLEIAETSSKHADLRYAESDFPRTAWAYYPSTSAEGGDAWFNNSGGQYDNPVKGNYAYTTFLHETGHALGLKHPHEVDGSFGAMPADRDSMQYTVMSYRSYEGQSTSGGYTNESWGYAKSLMMYDIAGIQKMYGANFGTNSGSTTYSWSSTTGEMSINGAGQGAPGGNRILLTVWDGGGSDTYDFSNYSTNLVISLQPGGWTTTSSTQLARLHYDGSKVAVGNIANALLYNNDQRSLIENSIGGTGNDTIFGNSADNVFTGGRGNDALDGLAGSDTAVFSGTRSNYDVTALADGAFSVTDRRSGMDGTDTIRNIESFRFADRTYTTDEFSMTAVVVPVIDDALVDDSYYNDLYGDVAAAGVDADAHFATFGWAEGRSPNEFFDAAYYRTQNPGVVGNPLEHYATTGWLEGKNPSAQFDGARYLQDNPDVTAANMNPLLHFLAFGRFEGRESYPMAPELAGVTWAGLGTQADAVDENPLVDDAYYNDHHPDVLAAGMDPDLHYATFGWSEGRSPNQFFDGAYYFAQNPGVVGNLLEHYATTGWLEGKNPSAQFDGARYLLENPDVAAANVNPLLHFLAFGRFEGRQSFDLTTASNNGGEAAGDTYSSVEILTGSAHADRLVGNGSGNTLSGGEGNDVLDGRASNENLYRGSGNDELIGSAGADVLDGGIGSDTASYLTATSYVIAELTTTSGSRGDAYNDRFASVENLAGSAHADTLRGNNSANLIEGGAGADRLCGREGNDTLTGGAGNDTLDGGFGTDSAVFAAASGDFSWAKNSDGSWSIVDGRAGSPEAIDRLLSVEVLKFPNTMVTLDAASAPSFDVAGRLESPEGIPPSQSQWDRFVFDFPANQNQIEAMATASAWDLMEARQTYRPGFADADGVPGEPLYGPVLSAIHNAYSFDGSDGLLV